MATLSSMSCYSKFKPEGGLWEPWFAANSSVSNLGTDYLRLVSEVGDSLWDRVLSLWGLYKQTLGVSFRTELNCRTSSWCLHRSGELLGVENPYILSGKQIIVDGSKQVINSRFFSRPLVDCTQIWKCSLRTFFLFTTLNREGTKYTWKCRYLARHYEITEL